MKRLIFLFVFGIMSLTGFSQIIINEKLNDSTYVKVSGMTTCRSFTDTQVLNVGVKQLVVNNDTAWYVAICINQMGMGEIPQDGRMLLKTIDNETIELYNDASAKSVLTINNGTTTTAYSYGRTLRMTTRDTSIKVNQLIGYYAITEEILNKLFNGILKVRIELTNKNYDKEFKKDKVGKALYNHYKELKVDRFNDDF